jgi:hypothetical protein
LRTQIDRWEYEILDDNTVEAWYLDGLNSDIEGCPPNLRQPHHPNGTSFADKDAAKAWIEGHIRSFTAAIEAAKAEEVQAEIQE